MCECAGCCDCSTAQQVPCDDGALRRQPGACDCQQQVPVIDMRYHADRMFGVPLCDKQPANACHCHHRCGKESFPERAEKTASSIKFHGGSFITGYTGEIIKQVN